jgi:hypothetical protein
MTLSQTAHLFAYVISAAVAVGLFCGLVGKLSTRQRSSGPAGMPVAEPVRHTEVQRAAALAELVVPCEGCGTTGARHIGRCRLDDSPPRPVTPHTAELRAYFHARRAEDAASHARFVKRIAGFDRSVEAKIARLAGSDWRTDEWQTVPVAHDFRELRELVAA